MDKKKISVRQIALLDIADEFSFDDNQGVGDRFDVLPVDLLDKEIARMNKELGIHKVNKQNPHNKHK